MTFAEKIDDYTVLDEKLEVKDGITYKVATLRTHSGYRVICRIPVHTKEEEKKIPPTKLRREWLSDIFHLSVLL